jgi:hypothetical protein
MMIRRCSHLRLANRPDECSRLTFVLSSESGPAWAASWLNILHRRKPTAAFFIPPILLPMLAVDWAGTPVARPYHATLKLVFCAPKGAQV